MVPLVLYCGEEVPQWSRSEAAVPGRSRSIYTKFEEFRTIPTFREYVLAEPDRMVVHLYRRQDDDSWSLTTYEAADEVPLESLGVRLPVAALYHKVRLRPGGA
jgi:Uma2 family endonuclease